MINKRLQTIVSNINQGISSPISRNLSNTLVLSTNISTISNSNSFSDIEVSSKINIPLVAGCGAGSLADSRDVVNAGASAVGIGSMFIFRRPHNAVLISYPDLNEIESLFN